MEKPANSTLMTQAEFAREKGVSRKTVTQWKQDGYLVMSGKMVDVRRSHEKLLRAGRLQPRPVVTRAQKQRSVGKAVDPKDLPEIAVLLSTIAWGAVLDVGELLLHHFEPEVVRPVLIEMSDRLRRFELEVMEDDGPPPPAPLRSWAEWECFAQDPLADPSWQEIIQEAAAAGRPRLGAAARSGMRGRT